MDNYIIYPEWCLLLDYASLTITIPIIEEHITLFKYFIGKGSEEEETFIKDVSWVFKNLNTFNILDSTSLDNIVNNLTQEIKRA